MITRLVLIRHGITKWNKERRYCGHKDIGLSREGKNQAKRLHRHLKNINFDKIYVSTRIRAIQTAGIIFKGARIKKMRELEEINFGVLEGLSYKEIIKKHNNIYKKWLKNPYKYHMPKAEPINAFKKRVCLAIKKITRANKGKTVAVVCHGGAIAIFISSILKNKNFWRYVPKAASLTIVECRKGKLKIIQFNRTKHLL